MMKDLKGLALGIIYVAILFIILVNIMSSHSNKNKNKTNTINSTNNHYSEYNELVSNFIKDNYDEKEHLVVENNYRFKNSIDIVTLYFKNIYTLNEINDIKPHNGLFLIMNITAISNTSSDYFYHFPYEIVDSNQSVYTSINDNYSYNYQNSTGETLDPATEINLNYVEKDEEKITAYNVGFVNGGNGNRNIVFDIPESLIHDENISFIFNGTYGNRYKNEVKDKIVNFYKYINN